MNATALPVEVVAAAERGGFSGAQYNHIATTARLDKIQLVKLEFEADAEAPVDGEQAELFVRRQLVSCRYDENDNVAAAIFQYRVAAQAAEHTLFSCVADYAVVYLMAGDAHAQAAAAFCKHVGLYAAYPYFRALAAQMSWNAGVPLPPLPSIAALPLVPNRKAARRKKVSQP